MNFILNQNSIKWLGVGLLALLLISAVHAEQGINVVPASLNINSTTSSAESRTLVISAKENVTDLTIIPLDLAAGDGSGVIPQQSIHTAQYLMSMTNGSIQQVPLKIDLTAIKSGTYSGELWVSYSKTGVVKVPVTAIVKDSGLWPLLILCFGVTVSYLLFTYGSSFKQRDEIRRTLGVIMESINNDQDLKRTYPYDNADGKVQNPFYNKIKEDIRTAESKLAIKAVSDAEKFMKIAQTNWDTWIGCKPRLMLLFDQYSDLITNMNVLENLIRKKTNVGSDESIPLITTMRENLQKKFDAIVTDADQKELENAIKTNTSLYNTFSLVIKNLVDLENICKTKDPATCPACENSAASWQSLKEIKEQADLTKASKDIGDTLEKVKICPSSGVKFKASGLSPVRDILPAILTPGKIPDSDTVKEGIVADLRLWLYNSGVFLIMVITLVGYGYIQFYISNPTFGASMGDYITIVVWGFMAGSTADVIATKMKGKIGLA